jgi:hypothetical protein
MTALTLDQLGQKAAAAIKSGDNAAYMSRNASLQADEHYLKAGKYLLTAKKQVKHGEWLAWLKKHGIAERTAQEHMSVASDKTSVSKIRDRKKEASRKIRAEESALRNADLEDRPGTARIMAELPDGITLEQAKEVFRNHFAGELEDDGYVCQLWRHEYESLN